MAISIPFIKQVSSLDKIIFAKDLALMIKSGLPLREAIDTVRIQSKNKKFKSVLADITERISSGRSLADSLTYHPKVFNDLYVNMIRVGEESGTLEENLNYLILQLEKANALKSKVIAALVYPIFILAAVFLLVGILIFFVLPQILPIFNAFDIRLPLATRILIWIVDFGKNNSPFILLGIVAIMFACKFIYGLPSVKFRVHKFSLRIPVFGSIIRNTNITNFSRTLGILLRSGLPIVGALGIVQSTLGNLVYKKELRGSAKQIQEGRVISEYLKKGGDKIFPLMVPQMIGVGEKTGKLEETLLYLGDFYEAEVDKATKNLSTVLEPFLLLVLGALVGFVALAIISPIYEITSGL